MGHGYGCEVCDFENCICICPTHEMRVVLCPCSMGGRRIAAMSFRHATGLEFPNNSHVKIS
jgi:hypothetical protein